MPFLPVELESAREAPRSAQTRPCRAFLRSGAHPPRPHLVLLASYLGFTLGHLFFFVQLVFCVSKCSVKVPGQRPSKGKSWPGGFSLVNSCSCMQMLANIFRIYPVKTLPSMKTRSIVLFKRLWPSVGEVGGGARQDGG